MGLGRTKLKRSSRNYRALYSCNSCLLRRLIWFLIYNTAFFLFFSRSPFEEFCNLNSLLHEQRQLLHFLSNRHVRNLCLTSRMLQWECPWVNSLLLGKSNVDFGQSVLLQMQVYDFLLFWRKKIWLVFVWKDWPADVVTVWAVRQTWLGNRCQLVARVLSYQQLGRRR